MLRYVGYLLLSLGILTGGLVVYVLDSTPYVTSENSAHLDDAESVSELYRQLRASLRSRYSKQHITVTNEQLNSLIALVQRAVPRFSGNVLVSEQASTLLATVSLPDNPVGNYVNLEMVLKPGESLNLSHVSVGGLSIPGGLAVSLFKFVGDLATGSDLATELVAHVERVRMFPSSLLITVQPLDGLLRKLNTFKSGISVSKNEELRLRTAFYLRFLAEMPVARHNPRISLVNYMSPLFSEASRQSKFRDPVEENSAAILALAVYTGHHRLANFIGDIQPSSERVALPLYRPRLAGRTDLTQHFVLSAGLKVLAEQGVSSALGEFKELVDRGKGGSGYSFVDLAADMAGVRFAQLATDPNHARTLQKQVAFDGTENLFFPPLDGLPEDLNKQKFVEEFGYVDSPEYKRTVEDIELRIDNLQVYQDAD